jgi:hypothetical protein
MMSEQHKPCVPDCEFFRCTQRSIRFKGKLAWCNFADDECEISKCKYSQCVRSRLLPDGTCGFTVVANDQEIDAFEVAKPVKVPAKLMQKIRERELF